MFRASGRIASLVVIAALAACSRGEEFVVAYGDPDPVPEAFHICHGFGCKFRSEVTITPAAWSRIAAPLKNRAADPAEERQRVARTIALFEAESGRQTGTSADKPGAGIFAENKYQQDCIDEAVNTTTYLKMLASHGLLKHHTVGRAAWRGHFIDRWPHNTAVLVENGGGAAYAIDSWFFANGVEPAIVPLETWKSGWKPPSA